MDPKELRIGNFVYADREIVEVVAIDSKEINDIDVKPSSAEIIRVKQAGMAIESIMLDVEMLKKCCGFDHNGLLHITIDKQPYYLKYKEGYVILLNNKQEMLIHFWDVKTFHQLQNLYFALTGYEVQVTIDLRSV